jgi:hypothetical protein
VKRALASILATVSLAGCSDLSGPLPTSSSTAASTNEVAPPRPPVQRTRYSGGSPENVIRAFATAYINWSAETISADMRALASRSIGQARSVVQLAAADAARDYELRRGGIANSGAVEAIALVRGKQDRYVVVTLERTTATNSSAYQGLRPSWHVALATVTELSPGRWILSGWQPES